LFYILYCVIYSMSRGENRKYTFQDGIGLNRVE
jgi:hypothetical protein